IVSVVPVLITPLPEEAILPALDAAVLATTHASALTVALFLAVYPKMASNFARPSLFFLPWRSYVLFGLVSYFFGNAVMYSTLRMIHVPEGWIASAYPLIGSSLFAVVFLVTTVTMSVLIDLRLMEPLTDYRRSRVRDGVVFAIVLCATMILLQLALIVIAPALDMRPMHVLWYVRVLFTGLFGGLGFVVGYL